MVRKLVVILFALMMLVLTTSLVITLRCWHAVIADLEMRNADLPIAECGLRIADSSESRESFNPIHNPQAPLDNPIRTPQSALRNSPAVRARGGA